MMKQGPRISDDGKFWWDGERWQPMQQPFPSNQPARHDLNYGQRPGNAFGQALGASAGRSFGGCGGCLLVIFVLLMVFAVLGSLHS